MRTLNCSHKKIIVRRTTFPDLVRTPGNWHHSVNAAQLTVGGCDIIYRDRFTYHTTAVLSTALHEHHVCISDIYTHDAGLRVLNYVYS